MAGIILWIIAGIIFAAAIIYAICNKNGNEAPIIWIGGMLATILVFVGFIAFTSPNSRYYRQTTNPNLNDINKGYASIDSVGVINGITQYEINWIGPQTGPREQ